MCWTEQTDRSNYCASRVLVGTDWHVQICCIVSWMEVTDSSIYGASFVLTELTGMQLAYGAPTGISRQASL